MSIPHVTPDSKLPADSGIYGILNTVTGKIYVGSTNNLHKRQWTHMRRLRRNIHTNPHLQAAYDKYGPEAFAWACLELVPTADLRAREAYWIDALRAADPACGYNLLGADSGRIVPTPETLAKITAANRLRAADPAWRAKISAANQARPPISEETRARMREGSRQPPATPEMRARLSAIHKQRLAEHPVTAEHRAALSAARRARPPASAETRAKQRAAMLARPPVSAETRAKLSAANMGRKKPPITEATRAKLCASQRMRAPDSAETRAKKSAASMGVHPTEVTRARMRAGQARRHARKSTDYEQSTFTDLE